MLVTLALGLVALLSMAALGIDVGRMYIAAVWAQTAADAAALAGAAYLPDEDAARQAVSDTIGAYVGQVPGDLTCDSSGDDVTFYLPGSYVSGWGELGSSAWALEVRCHVTISMTFAKVLGLERAEAVRRAVAIRAPAGKAAITPIWVPDGDYRYGELVELFKSPCRSESDFIPGNFGWLDPPSPEVDFITLLRGDLLTPAELAAATVQVGDTLSGLPGVRQGQTRSALNSRLERASQPPFDTDTWEDFHPDNPRVMVVPLVQYLGGHGTNATFRVVRFAAVWLESVNFHGCHTSILVRFVNYLDSNAYPDPDAPGGSVWGVRLVR